MNENVMLYGKLIAGAIGVAVTACLGLIPDGSTAWTVLTIVSAVATALAIYFAPHVSADPAPAVKPAKPTEVPQ